MTSLDAPFAYGAAPPVEPAVLESFDGTPIGYQVMGNPEGVPLLLANGLGGTYTAYRFIVHRFWRHFRFVCWDYRGLYSSGRPVSGYDGLSVEDNAKDGLFLVDKLFGGKAAFGLGWSKGVQVLLEMTRFRPGLFDGVVLHNGTAGRPYETLAGTSALKDLAPRALRASQGLDGLITKVVGFAVGWEQLIPLMTRLGLVHHDLDRGVFREMAGNFRYLDMHLYIEALLRLGQHDAFDMLPLLDKPTLLIASTNDRMTPLSVMQKMATLLPDARLEVVPGGSHYAAVEMPALVNRYLERFFRDRFPALGVEAT